MSYWERYDECLMCGAPAGARCVLLRGGESTMMPRSIAHPRRPKLPKADAA